LLVAALALTACKVDTTVAVEVEADGSGVITVTAVADAEVVAQAPGLAEDLRFDDAIAAGWVLDRPDGHGRRRAERVAHSPVCNRRGSHCAAAVDQRVVDGPLHGVALTRTVVDGDAVTTALTGTHACRRRAGCVRRPRPAGRDRRQPLRRRHRGHRPTAQPTW
jgi:hypothetical protein